MIEFLNKGAHISSLSGEKLTEQQAVLSVNAVCRKHGMRIDNFVLAPQWDDPPYYLLRAKGLSGFAGLGRTREPSLSPGHNLRTHYDPPSSQRRNARVFCVGVPGKRAHRIQSLSQAL